MARDDTPGGGAGTQPGNTGDGRGVDSGMSLEASFSRVLDGAQGGDNAAWTLIYDDLAPAVHAYVRVRGASDPEDVVGEVFLQLARNISGFEGDYRAFRSWTFVIAHHRMIDSHRRRSRRLEVAEEPARLESVDEGTDIERTALATVSLAWIEEVLAALTDDQRDVILLRVLGGLSVAETAEAVGKSAGAVRVTQHRALALLRDRLAAGDVTR